MWSLLSRAGWSAWRERRATLCEIRKITREEIRKLKFHGFNPLARAEEALAAGDLDTARRLWTELRASHPTFAKTRPEAVRVTIRVGLLDDAEEVTRLGMRRNPSNPIWLEGHAAVAEQRGDRAEAIQRWDRVRRKFPKRTLAYARKAGCLMADGQLDDAETLIMAAVRRFPDGIEIRAMSAHVAERRRDWPQALVRWNWMFEQSPHDANGVLGVARALRELERHAEAEAILTEARYRHPLVSEIAVMLAQIAEQRGDWTEADRRWELVGERWPNVPVSPGRRVGTRPERADGGSAPPPPTSQESAVR